MSAGLKEFYHSSDFPCIICTGLVECWEFIVVHIHYINRGIRDSLLMLSSVSILHVVYHLCSLCSLNKDGLVDLCYWLTCQESEQGVFYFTPPHNIKYDMLVSVLDRTKLWTYYECRKCEKIGFIIY